MQDYIDLAKKNGVTLLDTGRCQFCGADTKRGVHECLEMFHIRVQNMDFSDTENHLYRFLAVDAHALQHPEIHGRWSNHFHLSRLHLIFKYDIQWTYQLSPRLSNHLKKYRVHKPDEYLIPPDVHKRGTITITDLIEKSTNEAECKDWIRRWAFDVYGQWHNYHGLVDNIAKGFLGGK